MIRDGENECIITSQAGHIEKGDWMVQLNHMIYLFPKQWTMYARIVSMPGKENIES